MIEFDFQRTFFTLKPMQSEILCKEFNTIGKGSDLLVNRQQFKRSSVMCLFHLNHVWKYLPPIHTNRKLT